MNGPGTVPPRLIDGDETWTAEGSPYIIEQELTVTGNLLLEPCTVVQLAENVGFDVEGTVTARGGFGEDATPVYFVPLVDGEAWASIDLDAAGALDLEGTVLNGGGLREATIHAWGVDIYGLPHRNVRLNGVAISESAGYGVMLEMRAGFTEDSASLVIADSGSEDTPFPLYVEAGAVGTLPSDLLLNGNQVDEIYVYPGRPVEIDTFKNLGYPYRWQGELRIAPDGGISGGVPTLTIEAGVTLRLEPDASSSLTVGAGSGSEGQLVALGTADAPIRFESAAEQAEPADWIGLYFSQPVMDGNRLEYVEVAHAGAPSGAQGWGCGPIENDASILIFDSEPVPLFIQNSSIESAGGDTQILLGWDYDGDPSGSAQAIFEANSFDDGGPECRVSIPQDSLSACPGGDAEPDCL
jgi:hypothetical protein